MQVVIYDVETTGTPVWGTKLDDPCQPRIVQLSAISFSLDRKAVGSISVLLKRDGWVSVADAKSSHGISESMNDRYGVRQKAALATFMDLVRNSRTIASFGDRFMRTMMQIEFLRCEGTIPSEFTSPLRNHICIKTAVEQALNGGKKLKIGEAHQLATGQPFQHLFDAAEDCQAASRIFWSLVDQGKFS